MYKNIYIQWTIYTKEEKIHWQIKYEKELYYKVYLQNKCYWKEENYIYDRIICTDEMK